MTGDLGIDVSTVRGRETALVTALAVAAGLWAAFSGASPTGFNGWDGVLVFALAVAVVIAGSKAPRWATVVLAVAAAASVGISVWLIVAWVAMLLAVGSALLVRRSRAIGAIAAMLAVQVLVRLPDIGFFGLPSIIAGLAFVTVLWTGYRYSSGRARSRVRRAGIVIVGLAVVASFIGGLTLLSARTDVERGIAAAQRGLEAARAGDPDQVASELAQADSALSAAETRASSLPARLLRLVPVAGQHQSAIEVATEQGAIVAREAAAAVREADLDTITLTASSVDLGALQAMAPRLRATADALVIGAERIEEARTGWLLPPVSDRIDELLAEVEELRPEAELAAEAAEVVPALLGAGGPRSYFVIFGTPAESREFGGFLGSYAVLELVGGRLALDESGRISELFGVAASNVLPDGVAPVWLVQMGRPTEFPQNLPSTPDFETMAAVGQAIFAGAFDRPIDGYVYVDPYALIAMLELTGPVDVGFQQEPLTADNAGQFFFHDQYDFIGGERNELFDGLAEAADAVLASLVTKTLPGPEELGRVLGPSARAGRLQVVTFDERANEFLESVKLLRPFEATTQDFVGVIQTNGTPSKLDLYLQRDVAYDVAVGGDGALQGGVSVTLTSTVPFDDPVTDFTAGADQYGGVNRVLLSLYTPHEVTSARIDGVPVPLNATVEFGLNRFLVDAPVPPTGVPVVVDLAVAGQVDPDQPYALELWHQPLVNTDDVTVRYRGPEGAFTWSQPLVENVVLVADELVE